MARDHNAYLIQMSNINGEGIADVKSRACEILLDHRLTSISKDPKKAAAIVNRPDIAQHKMSDNVD